MEFIQIPFDREAAIAAMLYLVRQVDHPTLLKVGNIMFLADQSHIRQYQRSIFGATYLEQHTDHVPSEWQTYWNDADQNPKSHELKDVFGISDDQYRLLEIRQEPDMNQLSHSDIQCFQEGISAYKTESGRRIAGDQPAWNQAWTTKSKSLKGNPGIQPASIFHQLRRSKSEFQHLGQTLIAMQRGDLFIQGTDDSLEYVANETGLYAICEVWDGNTGIKQHKLMLTYSYDDAIGLFTGLTQELRFEVVAKASMILSCKPSARPRMEPPELVKLSLAADGNLTRAWVSDFAGCIPELASGQYPTHYRLLFNGRQKLISEYFDQILELVWESMPCEVEAYHEEQRLWTKTVRRNV